MGRTPYDFETYGVRDLRKFLKSCELPHPDPCSAIDQLFILGTAPFPPNVNKSHKNHILARHEKWRTLENIKCILVHPGKFFEKELIADSMNSLDLNEDPRYILPGALPPLYTHAPTDMETLEEWLKLVLVTATRVVHTVYPRIRGFGFYPGPNLEGDNELFRYTVWSPQIFIPSLEIPTAPAPLVVAYQPPHVLTQKDLEEFASCEAFPPFYVLGGHLASKHRLWAKIWDICQLNRASYFVLTSYTHWIFGTFSPGMRVGFISPIYLYNTAAPNPTLLETFIYWLCTSLSIPGTFTRPQVDEPISAMEDIDMEEITDLPVPPSSQSFWFGRDDGSSAGAELEIQSFAGESISSALPVQDRPPTHRTIGEIRKWLATCSNANHRGLDEDDLVYGKDPRSELEENQFHQDMPRGEWMISA
ncbi:hypothetical protein NLJ89_g690 [Agrocybe chaxingu]|uniref:Uncharacterized protein n=1 Tax=Agrocybe chaxingu TaxID=84603 RepID=A0A9W8N1L9_9AGAR|nr:hypothetical protein NLJ89_g690 [Agrocybe chaxingu]